MARARADRKGRGSRAPRTRGGENVVPEVYQEMLADATSSTTTKFNDEELPVKRRRIGGRVVKQGPEDTALYHSDQASTDGNITNHEGSMLESRRLREQMLHTESEDSADSDVDWEEVELKDTAKENSVNGDNSEDQELDLVLAANDHEDRGPPAQRRKPASAKEKKHMLERHMMHLLCLLVHVHRRNHWCNDEETQKVLSKLLSKRMVSYLNPDTQLSQFERSRSFANGLAQVLKAFGEKFKITLRGMRRSYWAIGPEDPANASPKDVDYLLQKSDFREIASDLSASRDVGAQLFCALLRSAGVEARLVCSLQPLPFVAVTKGIASQKAVPLMAIADPEIEGATSGKEGGIDAKSDASTSIPRVVGSRGGRNRFATSHGPDMPVLLKPRPKSKRINESPYPIYWVEAFDEANQKWITTDPLVTKTISRPSKLEPPASDPENQLSYVIAFEDDGSARDVTRRYAKAYNAKTRKERVEVTEGGDRWWRKVMKAYRRDHSLDRDQVEDAQLSQKEAQEGMPKSVQDFKDHPYYALERHLRRNQVLHPKREVGKVAAGKSGGEKILEPIYRRRDVHELKSGDKWYRLGRDIKVGQQPLKIVAARRKRESAFEEDQMSGDEDDAGTGLYADFQTSVYCAPPVTNGRIKKNIYGNLDIYVPSMVPAGGVHVRHTETARAAKILGVDYADAVTGFSFKGRHGTAVISGAIVATEYYEAILEVINAFEDERNEAEEARRSAEALRMWRRLLAGLRIRERIEGYEIEGERDALRENMDKAAAEEDDGNEGGGFLPDRDVEGVAEPAAGRISTYRASIPEGGQSGELVEDDGGYGGGFMEDEDADDQNKGISNEHPHAADQFIDNIEDDDRGGFYAYDIDEDAEEALRGTEPAEPADPFKSRDSGGDQWEEGGGFLPDHDIQMANDTDGTPVQAWSPLQAGGLLPNSAKEGPEQQAVPPLPAEEPSQNPIPQTEEPQLTALIHTSPLGLAAEDLAEATMLQQRYESPPTNTVLEDPAQSLANMPREEPLEALVADREEIPSPVPQAAGMEIEPGSPSSDPGSLLSQDPEDEDADPEWLA